jgi:hypothetical protein
VWIGEEADGSDFIVGVADQVETYHYFQRESITDFDVGVPLSSLGNWHALASLCQREYWHRRWIAQEIRLGQRVTVQCGYKKVDFTKVEAMCRQVLDVLDVNLLDQLDQMIVEE